MSEMLATGRLDVIAGEIRVIKEQVRRALGWASVSLGERLKEAKSICPHGQWGTYLATLDFSERTAQNAIRLYEEYGQGENPQAFAELSSSQALVLLGLPPDERLKLVEDEPVKAMSTRELQKRVKELTQEKSEAEKQREAFQANFEALKANAEKLRSEGERTQKDIETAKAYAKEQEQKAKTLKAELDREKAKELPPAPEPVTVVVNEVPPEVEAELFRLREVAKKAPCEAMVLVRASYEAFKGEFERLLELLAKLGSVMPEEEVKYRNAISQAATQMAKRMIGEEN